MRHISYHGYIEQRGGYAYQDGLPSAVQVDGHRLRLSWSQSVDRGQLHPSYVPFLFENQSNLIMLTNT